MKWRLAVNLLDLIARTCRKVAQQAGEDPATGIHWGLVDLAEQVRDFLYEIEELV